MKNPLPATEMKALENIVFGRAMKPETIERRAIARRRRVAESRANHIARLREIVATNDPSGIYAELLAEAEARQADTLQAIGD